MKNTNNDIFDWEDQRREKNPNWKGDNVTLSGIHRWIERNHGKPMKCEECGTTEKKRYDWANISGQYKRDFSDWKRLCRSCHVKFDKSLLKAWDTRRKTKQNKSGFMGVYRFKNYKKWIATFCVDGGKKYLGLFNTPEDAARAYNEAALSYHGEKARVNII